MTYKDTSNLNPSNDAFENSLLLEWLHNANMGMCVVDDISSIAMMNPAACQLLGVDGLKVLGQPFMSLLNQVQGDPAGMARLARVGAPDVSGKFVFTRTLPNLGGHMHLLVKFSSIQKPGHGAYQVIAITDISSLMAAQQQVDSEAFRKQWQALNAGVVISDARAPDMPIVFVNAMFEEMSGYTSTDIVGRNCRFLQGEDTDQPGLKNIRDAIARQTSGYATLRNYRKDGSLFLNQLFISPVRDAAGVVTHYVGIQHTHVPASALN
jgi:PAS domain S-box-containing protein